MRWIDDLRFVHDYVLTADIHVHIGDATIMTSFRRSAEISGTMEIVTVYRRPLFEGLYYL